MSVDELFCAFASQWAKKDPQFHLDDSQVREDLMSLISASMSLLAVAPPAVWQEFMRTCAATAKQVVPVEIQERIKSTVT